MTTSSKLLIDEPPLQVLPTLACALGLNEALVIQQVHYWLKVNERQERTLPAGGRPHFHDGRWWVYNSYAEWRDQFPFWSEVTIKRICLGAERRGVLISRQVQKSDWDRRKWYTLDYAALNRCLASGSDCAARTDQVDPIEGVQLDPLRTDQVDPFLKESETTTETTAEMGAGAPPAGRRLTEEQYKERIRQALERGERRQALGEPDLSWLAEDLWPLARAFVVETGIRPVRADHPYWRRTLAAQREMGLTPAHIAAAVQAMRADQLTVADPGSVTKTARALAAAQASPAAALTPMQAAARRDPTLAGYVNRSHRRTAP